MPKRCLIGQKSHFLPDCDPYIEDEKWGTIMDERGLILVNTGDGKGKTTAALGTAIRALGQGYKVAFFQFIKDQETGESRMLKEYAESHPGMLLYKRMGLGCFGNAPSEADKARAAEALREARDLVTANYDLVVLDEICVALSCGLIPTAEVAEMLKNKWEKVNIILTGRGAPQEIIDLADTVTEMSAIKHAYEKGITAKRGIEF
jgi:cob(I)alamin adenosyltransferase